MLSNYFIIALRNLKKNTVFASLNTLGLGLSIACCLLIFMFVRHHRSFDQFHAKLDRIAMIGTEARLEEVQKDGDVPYPMGEALRQEYAFLEKTAMLSRRSNTLVTIEKEGQPSAKFMEENARAFTEPTFFDMFDFPLAQGSFQDFNQPLTVLLTERLARKYYGTTDAVGKTLKIHNRSEYRVVGVLKDLPENTDLRYEMFTSWATLSSDSNSVRMLRNWGGIHGGTQCFAMFREGNTVADLEAAFPAFREKYFHPEVRELHYHAIPFQQAHFDADYGFAFNKKLSWTLALIGLFLLLTACINFVNMATAQAFSRAREVGVRKSMGSTRGQLFWQFISETGVIVCISTLAGLAGAWVGLPWLNQLADTELTFGALNNVGFYTFAAGLMIAVTFLAGAYPGLALSRFSPTASLKGGFDQRQIGGFSLRRVLVGTQFAISQALIIAAVVVTAQMRYAEKADLGFRREGIVNIGLPGPDQAKKTAFLQQIESMAGVEKASLCFQPPSSDGNWNTNLRLQGRATDEPWSVNLKFVDHRYAETFELPLRAGRNLVPSDTIREFLVNEALARKLGFVSPDEIVGKILAVNDITFPVVGVVKDFHNHSFHDDIQPQVFCCQADDYGMAAVRINMQGAKSTLDAIEKAWSGIYPEYVYEYEFMDDQLAKFYEQERVILQLVQLFAYIAVFIGCLGLYGLAAFMIARKTKEVGIRKTLGASIAGILWLFGKEYARLIAVAFLIAAPLAAWMMRGWLADYAYRVEIGVGVFALAFLSTVAIAALTVGFQSAKAALANPVRSLKSE